MHNKPLLLCILDGWGIGNEEDKNNSIIQAKTPNYTRFLKTYPNSQLITSGIDVGLPEGQMGNSEVGHMTIGAGRIIFQDLPRINNAISDKSFAKNSKLLTVIEKLKFSGKALHLAGLLSDGGVHAHINHIIFLAKFAASNGVKVLLHAFLDGRDVAQKSAIFYLQKFLTETLEYKNIEIATISGRYYAMDRDSNLDRTTLAYDAIVNGNSSKYCKKFSDAISVVNSSYKKNLTDEFLKPHSAQSYCGVSDGDILLFCNFRADRARQISNMFFENRIFSQAIAFTEYSKHLNNFYQILFPTIEVKNSLPEILSKQGLTQLRIAETEKYAHVTFFFSCGIEEEMIGEERILIKSPAVATYDLQPEMSARIVGEKLREAIRSNHFNFIIVNYANPDMVGHSGLLSASIKACEVIDEELGMLEKEILSQDGLILISADHGNVECMLDENQQPHTSHTTNPVPFILIGNKTRGLSLANGRLSDIAPTILELMGIKKPIEMDGKSLIK